MLKPPEFKVLNENGPRILNRKIFCVPSHLSRPPRHEGHLTAEHETPTSGRVLTTGTGPRVTCSHRRSTATRHPHLLGTRPPRSTHRRPTDAPAATRPPGLGAQAALVALAVALVWTSAHAVAVLTALALLTAAAVAAALDDRGRPAGRPTPLAE